MALDISTPMVFNEFESEVDAILVGFGGNRADKVSDQAFLELIAGQV
ncbi:MAG TPA: hypothetical protein VJ953_13820 [Saprospiraceae bacterium]|nr:hypothetical protein [Saprospiraceae bacterium]